MYTAVFIPTMIYNSEAWSRLTATNIKQLQTAQLKCLKRIMKAAPSTPNSFVFLELGILPMEYEINKRQLVFLHHILSLPDTDPVRGIYEELKAYPMAANWFSNITKLLVKYNLPSDEQNIVGLSRDTWKSRVKQAVVAEAVKVLLSDAKSKKKLSDISLPNTLKTQEYLMAYSSDISIVIFKLRGRSVNCLKNRGSDGPCRLCGHAKETQEHAINCPIIASGCELLSLQDVYGTVPLGEKRIRDIASRWMLFEEKVTECTSVSNNN